MPRISVTTDAQRAEARRVSEQTGRKYATILRALQRGSSKGAAGKQRRSGAKVAEQLREVSPQLSQQLRLNINPYRAVRWKTDYGEIVSRETGEVTFFNGRNRGEKSNSVQYDLFVTNSREDALRVAREYQIGQGDQMFASLRAKRFVVEFRPAGTTVRIKKRSKKRGKRAYETDTVTDGGQGGQWFVVAEGMVPTKIAYDNDFEISSDDDVDIDAIMGDQFTAGGESSEDYGDGIDYD